MNKLMTAAAALMLLGSSGIAFAQNNNGNNADNVGAAAAQDRTGTKDCQQVFDSSSANGQDVQCSSSAQQGTGANPDEGITNMDATGSTGSAVDNSTDAENSNATAQ